MTSDTLYNIFFNRLSETHLPSEGASELIQRVTREYMLYILQHNIIPIHFVEEVFDEVQSEVLEIYRKKTYGFLTLSEFRAHHFDNFVKTE